MGAGGNIINIASIFGLRGSVGSGPYAMSKAAIVGLTRQLATDYGPRGIRANAVAPGLIETPMTADRIQNDREFRRIMVDTTPFPRVGTPNDIANAVAFLASDQAAFISGHVLVVDGGWLAGNNPRDTGAENIHVS
jgi:3-oxoacyl-[acyl-carrier protein] reductase